MISEEEKRVSLTVFFPKTTSAEEATKWFEDRGLFFTLHFFGNPSRVEVANIFGEIDYRCEYCGEPVYLGEKGYQCGGGDENEPSERYCTYECAMNANDAWSQDQEQRPL